VRYRVRFGYDGTGFAGWARQPRARTVEGEILEVLRSNGLVPGETRHLEVASRTDRGVSARANALALDSTLDAPALLGQLNGIAPDIFFTATAPFPFPARIRAARRRRYRYYETPALMRRTEYREALAVFPGTIDVRSVGRGLPSAVPAIRPVEIARIAGGTGGPWVEIVAPSFVWGMVRKIVGACREVVAGRLTIDRLRRALEGAERLTLPLAEPEPLVLWEVEYVEPWTTEWRGPNRRQAAALSRAAGVARARAAVHASLTE
jgi:tRNA pseudouridine38-40 synthase